jgi:exodeoxyribonuclease VII large subunit
MNKRRSFERAAAKLSPDMLARRLVERKQKLTENAVRAERVIERLIERNKARLGRFDATLTAVPARLKAMTERSKDRLESLGRRADSAVVNDLRRARQSLVSQDRVLQSLSYKNVLARGYAVIRDENDRPVSRADGLSHGQTIAIEFADGRVDAVAGEGVSPPEPSAPQPARAAAVSRPARKSEPPAGQGSLF